MEKRTYPPTFATTQHLMEIKKCSYSTAVMLHREMKLHFGISTPKQLTVDQACIYMGITKKQYLQGIGFLPLDLD